VGNGLGGVAAGSELRRMLSSRPNLAEVTLVGPSDQYVFKPQLHESLNGKAITVPMRKLFPLGQSVQYKQATVTKISIDPAKKELETSNGKLPFDYLIISVGGKTAYYGHNDAATHAIPMESPADIARIQASVQKKLAQAANAPTGSEAQKKALSFVIVGGGATGVETAFDLQEFVQNTIQQKFPALAGQKPTVTIVEAMPDILNGFSDKEKQYVKKRLAEKGIQVLYNHPVQNIGPNGLVLTDKNQPEAKTVTLNTEDPVWVTGVRAHPLVEQLPVERLPGNQRVKVNPFLEIPKRPDVYVIGDSAGALDAKTGKPLPPTGQVAQQQGYFVAKDLVAKLEGQKEDDAKRKPFEYHHQGTMFSIGSSDGSIHSAGGWFITGRKARLAREAVYYKKTHYP
jgi:NADH dehydrogenase